MNRHKGIAAVAVVVVVLLGVLGINRIGGETWTSVAAGAEAGFYAHSGPFTPLPTPVYRAFLVPLIMILVVIAVVILGAILKRLSDRRLEGTLPQPPDMR